MVQETIKSKITNLGALYRRSFTDIPYAKEIATAVIGNSHEFEEYKRKRNFDDPGNKRMVVPLMEARYKALDAFILRSGIKQVVEIAAGWTQRGAIMVRDPAINYIDTDQDAAELKEKERIFTQLGINSPNLHIVKFDAVTGEGLKDIEKLLKPGEVCIIHEGFFRYLPHAEKSIVLGYIRKILKAHGGVYITNDIEARDNPFRVDEIRSTYSRREDDKVVSQITGTSIEGNIFETLDEAQRLVEQAGFIVERHKYGEVIGKLSSVELFSKSEPNANWSDLEKMIGSRDIWLMTLKK